MSVASSQSVTFYTIAVGNEGGFVVRGSDRECISGVYETQVEAVAAAKRLNLAGERRTVELSAALVHGASLQAEKEGMSVADWISNAVEDRIRNEELAERVFHRAVGADRKSLEEVLAMVGNGPPVRGDELPEGYSSTR